MLELPDGTYDAFVVDVEEHRDERLRVEVTITSGEHKGVLVALTTSRAFGDATSLLGMPATLRVVDGAPHLHIQR